MFAKMYEAIIEDSINLNPSKTEYQIITKIAAQDIIRDNTIKIGAIVIKIILILSKMSILKYCLSN